MLPHELYWIHTPAHPGKTGVDETLSRGQPVGGERDVVSECLADPLTLQSVLLVEGESGRIADRFQGDALGKMPSHEAWARSRMIAERAERYSPAARNRLFETGDGRQHPGPGFPSRVPPASPRPRRSQSAV